MRAASTQFTLLGSREVTCESLYLLPALLERIESGRLMDAALQRIASAIHRRSDRGSQKVSQQLPALQIERCMVSALSTTIQLAYWQGSATSPHAHARGMPLHRQLLAEPYLALTGSGFHFGGRHSE